MKFPEMKLLIGMYLHFACKCLPIITLSIKSEETCQSGCSNVQTEPWD